MTGIGLEHRLATSVKSISFLLHCAKMAAAAPGITTVSRQKRRSWHMSPRHSFFQKIKTLSPGAIAASCMVLISQKWPTTAVRDIERVSTPYIVNRQG